MTPAASQRNDAWGSVRKYFLTPVIITFKAMLRVWRWCWVSDVTGERREGQPAAPAETRAADTEVRSNEALADLTNSSLIQNSSHRQFHIISRSRTLLQHLSHCCNSDCSRRVQQRFFYRISIKIWNPRVRRDTREIEERGENCGHNNRTSILGVIQTIRCNWLRLDWKSQISHKFPFYLLHLPLPQNWGNTYFTSSQCCRNLQKITASSESVVLGTLEVLHLFCIKFCSGQSLSCFCPHWPLTPHSRMKPLNAMDQSLISPLLLDKIDEFVCPLFEDLWSKVLPEEMIFVFHRWLGALPGLDWAAPVTGAQW